ncbi:cell wall anchor protein [Oscillospiraceae bacterium 50-60]
MKKLTAVCALALALTMALAPAAHAAEWAGGPHVSPAQRVAWGTEEQGSVRSSRRQAGTELSGLCNNVVCYPTSVTRSEDGTEIRKLYDLSPEDDPAGIPRSDFQQDGFRYTLVDLLRQELPENESRQHTETVSLESKDKDMASVLALLPQQREFVTDDGLSGTLTLQLDTVQVDVSGYGSSTRAVNVTRSYPNLAGQDTQYIPKTIQDGGRTLTLQDVSWQTDNTGSLDGYALGDRYTAVATYSGSATSSYVKGYTVSADYTGTVSRIALNKTRYVAIFEGTPLQPVEDSPNITEPAPAASFNWPLLLVPLGLIAAAGGGIGIALFLKRRGELAEDGNGNE